MVDLLPALEGVVGEVPLPHAGCARPAAAVGGDLLPGGLGQSMPEMPSVSDLHRLRERVAHGLSIGGGSVPADDLDATMSTQPLGDDLRAPAGQHVDSAAGVGVDEHGGVLPAPAEREIIDAQHPRHPHFRQRNPQQRTQCGVPGDVHAQGR